LDIFGVLVSGALSPRQKLMLRTDEVSVPVELKSEHVVIERISAIETNEPARHPSMRSASRYR
jgi:hypothetical protein